VTLLIFEGKPAAGFEVYSSNELVRASVSDSTVIRRRMGPKKTGAQGLRLKFVDGRLMRRVFAALATKNNVDKH
jgi:hypothetical protein